MSRRPVGLLGVALACGAMVLPADAAPKTIEKSFDVTIPVPLLGSVGDIEGACTGNPAGADVPNNVHVETFSAPAAGQLKVEVTGFVGDWDMALESGGKRLAEGSGTTTPTIMSTGSTVEKLTYKVKKPGEYDIVICNFVGGPTGTGKYVFTYGK